MENKEEGVGRETQREGERVSGALFCKEHKEGGREGGEEEGKKRRKEEQSENILENTISHHDGVLRPLHIPVRERMRKRMMQRDEGQSQSSLSAKSGFQENHSISSRSGERTKESSAIVTMALNNLQVSMSLQPASLQTGGQAMPLRSACCERWVTEPDNTTNLKTAYNDRQTG
ncbi:hypothetical protein INR49_012873 [Caranx melampygus]|nr:hypothetical protein INR49_012873 [Caranx melampygus]